MPIPWLAASRETARRAASSTIFSDAAVSRALPCFLIDAFRWSASTVESCSIASPTSVASMSRSIALGVAACGSSSWLKQVRAIIARGQPLHEGAQGGEVDFGVLTLEIQLFRRHDFSQLLQLSLCERRIRRAPDGVTPGRKGR
jgi:hypothetical protein